ncbi:MAG TPA: protein translocase subunit SecD, partial [Anaerolineaceae bacterium]
MNKNLGAKAILIVAVLLVFFFGIIGWPQNWSGQGILQSMTDRIHLGLDLKGGTHLILQVQVNDAVRAESERSIERLKADLKQANIPFAAITIPDPANKPEQIAAQGVPAESAGDLRRIVGDRLPEYDLTSGAENTFFVTMRPSIAKETKDHAVTQAIETIRNRIDQLGVSEPVIEEHGLGQYQILVQLPGVDDPARVKEIMQSTAMLEIRQAEDNGQAYESEQAALAAHGGVLPPDTVVMKGTSIGSKQSENGEHREAYYIIASSSAVSGRDLRSADAGRDEMGRPNVHFTLTADGGHRFSEFTRGHINDFLAVVLDNKVQEVARINSEISDSGEITGGFTEQEAKDLSMILRSGALPAGIKYLEERTVGPSLGADSIRAGVRAAVIGMVAVMIFMLVYYRAAGINADVALVLNLIILLGF